MSSTGTLRIPSITPPGGEAKDTFWKRQLERILWAALTVVLARAGISITDGYVQANDTATAKTVQLDQERSTFGAYIAERLKSDKALEPLIIHCLADHPEGRDDAHAPSALVGTYEDPQ